jgi:drug/metabolite transporter (DMT)-like permease
MIFILISILLFSLNNVLWKKNLQTVTIPFLVGYRAFFTSLISCGLVFYYYDFQELLSLPYFKITIGSVFGVMGLFCMLTVIKNAPLQWLGIYNLIGVVFTAVYLFFVEKIVLFDSVFGLVLIIVGFLVHLFFNKEKDVKITFKQHFYLLLMTLLFSTSSLIHWKNLASEVPALVLISNQEFVVFITALLLIVKTQTYSQIKLEVRLNLKKVIVMASLIFSALLFSFLGLKVTNPLISSLLFLSNPLLTIVFAAIFFKEKINLYTILALIFISSGAFILHLQSV